MKNNTEKLAKITINNDEVDSKEQDKEVIEISNKNPKEMDYEGLDKVLKKIEPDTKDNNVNIQETPIKDNAFHKDRETEPTIKDNKEKIAMVNIILSLLFSFLLLVVSLLQYTTYNRQANIAENSNKLAQYQYRFEFYKKLEDLQQNVSIIEKNPQLDIEQLSELNYKILSLYRESALLFDQSISKDINKILDDHMKLLHELNNEGMFYDDYEKRMEKLIIDYGDFINSDNFKNYIDINAIE